MMPSTPTGLPEAGDKTAFVRDMFDRISPRYDLVNRVMTFGLDVGWRRRTVSSLGLSQGSVILDLACGTGDLCRELLRQRYWAVGADISWGMLSRGRPRVVTQCMAEHIPIRTGGIDGVTCGFALRNFTDLSAVTRELARVTRPGGRIALLEVAEPKNRIFAMGHRFHFRTVVPMIGRILSDGEAYQYLPDSVAYLPPAETLKTWLREAGFDAVQRTTFAGGATQLVTATRRHD